MTKTIHPELRTLGKVFKLLFRSKARSFRFYHWLSSLNTKAEIKGFVNETHWVDGRNGEHQIRVRVYRPHDQTQALPVLLYLHGGGYAFNSPEGAHREISSFLSACPCVVVAPDYTKSVKKPYPAAINDCEDTLDWLLLHALQINVRTDKLIIGGHSAGGGLTLALMLRIRQRGDVAVAFQMPIYPMIDHRSNTESASNNDMPVWSTKHNKLAWELYLSGLDLRNKIPEDAAPAGAEHYKGLPPAVSYVGDLDPFLDETKNMVEALKRDGVTVEFEIFEQCYHAFDLVAPDIEPSKSARRLMQRAFSDAINQYKAPQPDAASSPS